MAEHPWFSFYPADYLADTSDLSPVEHGVYLLLMLEAYQRGGFVRCERIENASVSHRLPHRVCRCEGAADKAAVDMVLARYFVLEDDRYIHRRVEKEIAKRAEKSVKASESARQRWDANALRTDMRTPCETDAVTTTVTPTRHTPQKQAPRGVVGGGPGEPRKPKKLAAPPPDPLVPDDTRTALAARLGVDAIEEAAACLDWAISGNVTSHDWQRRLGNWYRKAATFPKANGNGRASPAQQRQDATMRAAEEVNAELRARGIA